MAERNGFATLVDNATSNSHLAENVVSKPTWFPGLFPLKLGSPGNEVVLTQLFCSGLLNII